MTFKPFHDPSHLYFITATVLGWQKIFSETPCARIVLKSLNWHRQEGRWSLYAYVLMPSHLHAIIKPLGDRSISRLLQSFGSYTAHEILAHLEDQGRHDLMDFFSHRQDKNPDKEHRIWQPIQAKNVYSIGFLREKLEYIHDNPAAKRWRLVEDRADYAYSSACFYDRDVPPVVAVDDIREWF